VTDASGVELSAFDDELDLLPPDIASVHNVEQTLNKMVRVS